MHEHPHRVRVFVVQQFVIDSLREGKSTGEKCQQDPQNEWRKSPHLIPL
jgi:hypothetical protein